MDSGSDDILSESDENTLVNCREKCYINQECTAFSYETQKFDYYSCVLLKGGPYIAGIGRPNTKCYNLKQGTFISFYIYTNEYTIISTYKKLRELEPHIF